MTADETRDYGISARRKPSPFLNVDLVNDLETYWPARLLVQELANPPASMVSRFGQLLACAIWHGAMLAPRWWPRWLEAAQRHMSVEGRLWLEMERIDEKELYQVASYPRRWFADPMSQLLLLKWRANFPGDCTAVIPAPEICLAAYLDPSSMMVQATGRLPHQALLSAAILRWRLRAPGVIVDYARGLSPALSLPPAAWHRLLTDRAVQSAPAATKPHPPLEPSYTHGSKGKSQDAGRKMVQDLFKIIKAAARSTDLESKAELRTVMYMDLRSLRCAEGAQSVAQHLLEWSIFMLHQKKLGTANWRFQPRSALGYVGAMRRQILRHDGVVDFASVSRTELESLYIRTLDKISPGSARNTLINALRSFQEYLGNSCARLALPLDRFDVWRSATEVSVGIVSSHDYRRALKKLGVQPKVDTRMLRIMLILGFRTGLRFHEIFGLTIDDFIVPDNIKGNDAFEMTVRRNRERNTKTELSRRILPLHLLLNDECDSGMSELGEVRMWVDHRRQEAMLTGRKRIFVNPAWPTVRPSYQTTEKRLDELLRQVSGDDTACFRSLRHSFASYLLATMLLPEDAGPTIIPLAFTKDIVSVARRERMAGPLLGEGRNGQASVHAVSQLCGHAPVSTTLQSYSHLLDWTLATYVDRLTIQPGLSITDAASLTTLTESALRKLVQRSRSKPTGRADRSGPQTGGHRRPNLPPRSERARGFSNSAEPSSVYLDEVLIAATRKISKNASTAGHPIVVWSERAARRSQKAFTATSQIAFRRLDWRHVKGSLSAQNMGYDIEGFARRQDYPLAMIEGWILHASGFRSARRPDGRLRHLASNSPNNGDMDLDSGFPRSPASGRETIVADRIWAIGITLSGRKLRAGLAIFRDFYDGQKNEVRPATLAGSRAFASLLKALSLTVDTTYARDADVVVRHCPGRGKPKAHGAAVLATLSRPSVSADRWHGNLAFTLARRADEGTGYGLRFALTMLAIAVGENDNVNEADFADGFRERRELVEKGETDLMQRGERVKGYRL
jgi:site-specific recombinase XerD